MQANQTLNPETLGKLIEGNLLTFDSLKNLQRSITESVFDVAFRFFENHYPNDSIEQQLCTLRQILYTFWDIEDLQEGKTKNPKFFNG